MRSLALCAVVGWCSLFVLTGCGPSPRELRTRGVTELQVGHVESAKALLQQVLDRHPADPEALYYLGRAYHAEGAYEMAIFYYQSALDADPSNNEARKFLAIARTDSGGDKDRLRIIPDR